MCCDVMISEVISLILNVIWLTIFHFQSIQLLTKAADEITHSNALKQTLQVWNTHHKSSCFADNIFQLVLAIGNFMNYGPRKSPTEGFKISFLNKVSDGDHDDDEYWVYDTVLSAWRHQVHWQQANNDPLLGKTCTGTNPSHHHHPPSLESMWC